jgi:NitT/TauT family transport system permease protein
MNGAVRRWIARVLPPVVVLVGAVALLEAYIRLAGVPSYVLPRPADVIAAMKSNAAELFPSLGWTALAALVGFAASAIFGALVAIGLSASLLVRRALYPYTVFFQTVPIVAIAPLLVLWISSRLQEVIVCAFIVSVFPVIANMLTGLLSTDPALVDLFRLYGARPIARLWKLRLPSSLPSLFTGLRVAGGLAVIGTVVAEILVGNTGDGAGLGVRVYAGIKYGHTDRAFAAVLLVSMLGLAFFGAINLASHLALRRWHASER